MTRSDAADAGADGTFGNVSGEARKSLTFTSHLHRARRISDPVRSRSWDLWKLRLRGLERRFTPNETFLFFLSFYTKRKILKCSLFLERPSHAFHSALFYLSLFFFLHPETHTRLTAYKKFVLTLCCFFFSFLLYWINIYNIKRIKNVPHGCFSP